ncbi:probable inactive shikimate kinase like 2, chloroplastic [Nymphaea colorata]|nr:probable inactive shikimate kinase like 2, chloroplastic [Nymphaea colorata]
MALSFISNSVTRNYLPFQIPSPRKSLCKLLDSSRHLKDAVPVCSPPALFCRSQGFASLRRSASAISLQPANYEFSDSATELELRIPLMGDAFRYSEGILVDTDESSLIIKFRSPSSVQTLMEVGNLYDRIKPAETIWYIDEDQLVVNLKKHDPDLKWPDIMETWESLSTGVMQLLKGTSIYTVGNSSEMNWEVAKQLASGLGYAPLNTSELLETIARQSIDTWIASEGADSVAEAEGAILESLSSHARAVVATLGGSNGAAGRADKWRHLYAGFTVWLDLSEASEKSAEEVARNVQSSDKHGYSNADVIVRLEQWDSNLSQIAAQACLSALKRLILSDKQLPGKKSLYIRLGCRGDWPNIEPPGYDPSKAVEESS